MSGQADEKEGRQNEQCEGGTGAEAPGRTDNERPERGDGSDKTLSQEQIEQLQRKAAERDEFLDLLQRLRADYANYQKRVHKERESDRRYAAVPLITELLNVLDNFERAIDAAEAEEASPGLLHGIRMIYEQLLDTLQRHGVQQIEAEGQPFDPDAHEAVTKQETDHVPPGTVIRVLQRGYKLHDRVVRPAKVAVADRPEGAGQVSESDTNQSRQEQACNVDANENQNGGTCAV